MCLPTRVGAGKGDVERAELPVLHAVVQDGDHRLLDVEGEALPPGRPRRSVLRNVFPCHSSQSVQDSHKAAE